MRLPTYYCPHCERFKRNNFIDRIDDEFGTYCRGCLTELITTESILFEIVKERSKRKDEEE